MFKASRILARLIRSIVAFNILFIFVSSTFFSNITLSYSGETVDIYLYKIIIETDSDWTKIYFSGGPIVIGYNYTIIRGLDAPNLTYSVEQKFVYISKKSYDQTYVSINVSIIAIKGNELGQVIIRKGDIGSTNVSMYALVNGNYMFLWKIVNKGKNPQYPGTNDRIFQLDFKQLYKHPAGIGIYEDVIEGFNKQVFAFYYPWYGVAHGASGQWFHWEGVSENYIANAAHYPLLGIYDSWDERLIEAHILLAKYAGIDGFIVSWWGIATFEDQALKRIIKVAEKYDFKITVYYESYRPWNPLISADIIINELSYIVREYSKSSSFLKINGKPVIFIYNVEAHNRGPNFWLQIKKNLENKVGSVYLIADLRNPSYLHVFDGFHTYIELNSDTMKKLYSFYVEQMKIGLIGLSFNDVIAKIQANEKIIIQRKVLFYTVIPGYDDRKIRKPGIYVDREEGNFYKKMWNDALELGTKCIIITSWNELHEGTEIEPTKEYGLKYLEITRNYVSKFKQVNIEKPLLQNLTLNIFISESKDEFYLRLFNNGDGHIIAVNVEIIPSHGIAVYFTDTYRQPFKTGFELVIIPLIKSGEEYTLAFKIKKLSKDIFNVSRLIIHYYSLNGSLYNIEYLINIQETTLTVTETDTKIITQTTTDTLTQTKIATSTLATITRYITATSAKQATDNFWFITLITIILAICLTLAVIYLYKIKGYSFRLKKKVRIKNYSL
jgi:hypothetical protein